MSARPDSSCFLLENVSKSYGSERAVGPVAVCIPWGVRVAVVGPSGSGKSTLLHLLGLMDAPDNDTNADIVYFRTPGTRGFSYTGRTGEDRVPIGRDRDGLRGGDFGFVFQRHHLLSFLTARDNVGLGLMAAGVAPAPRRELSSELLTRLGLADQARQRPGELSGGQAQRVAVARALAHNPRVVFADEPTGNLDRGSAEAVLQALTEWQSAGTPKAPRTLVLVTHDLPAAVEYCDRFLVVRNGRLHPGHANGALFGRTEVDSPDRLFRLTTTADDARAPERESAPPPITNPTPRAVRPVRFRDLLRLSWTDLTVSGHRLASASAFVLLVLATVLALVAAGFRNGQREVLARLDNEEARALVVTGYTDRVNLIDDETFQKIRALKFADGRSLYREEPPNVFRWNHDSRAFRIGPDPIGRVQEQNALGRSISPDDPVLARRGWSFDDPHGPEIIVSTAFLRDHCQVPPDAAFVWLDYENQPVRLRIVFRAEELPDAPHYILPEPFYQQLNTHQFKPKRTIPYVDLVFPSAAAAGAATDSVREKAKEYDLEVESPADDRCRVRLRVPGGGRLALPVLSKDAAELSTAAGHLARVEAPPPDPEKAQVPGSECLTVYLERVEDREEAAKLLTDIGLKEAYTVQTRLVRIYNQTVVQLAGLVLVLAGVAVLSAALNLVITMDQRVREKTPEVGILRACGLRAVHVRAVFAVEGIVLGSLAAVVGWILMTFLLGPRIERIVASMTDGAGHAIFRLGAVDVAVVTAFTIVSTTAVCAWACGRAINTPPASAVR